MRFLFTQVQVALSCLGDQLELEALGVSNTIRMEIRSASGRGDGRFLIFDSGICSAIFDHAEWKLSRTKAVHGGFP